MTDLKDLKISRPLKEAINEFENGNLREAARKYAKLSTWDKESFDVDLMSTVHREKLTDTQLRNVIMFYKDATDYIC